ncbi:MAG: chitinase [Candidatus Aquirickettsiella sp.]
MRFRKNVFLAIISLFICTPMAGVQASTETHGIFSPYADISINAHWDPQYQDMEPPDLVKLSADSGVTNYHLAFITDVGACHPAWAGQSDYSVEKAWGSHLTDNMRAQGIHYTIAFGGASGTDISSGCDNEAQLVAAYEQIIKTYQPAGLDFDIENSSIDVPKLMKAVRTVQTSHPELKISFTLPILPEGLIDTGKSVVRAAQANGIKNYVINVMAMDYGPNYKEGMGKYATQAAGNLFAFLKTLYPEKSDAAVWQMVGITPMIGINDVNVEKFTLADADVVREFAVHTGVGLTSMWSAARDNPCADAWASPVCSGGSLQKEPNEYAKHFLSKN